MHDALRRGAADVDPDFKNARITVVGKITPQTEAPNLGGARTCAGALGCAGKVGLPR